MVKLSAIILVVVIGAAIFAEYSAEPSVEVEEVAGLAENAPAEVALGEEKTAGEHDIRKRAAKVTTKKQIPSTTRKSSAILSTRRPSTFRPVVKTTARRPSTVRPVIKTTPKSPVNKSTTRGPPAKPVNIPNTFKITWSNLFTNLVSLNFTR